MILEKKQTILVVDDIAENIDVVASSLSPFYNIKVALNGNDALTITKSIPRPDLILLDIVMPEMDGYELCSLLKKDPDTKEIPILFVTAMDDIQDETKGFDVGAVDYITKPICAPIMLARVRAQLELKKYREEIKQQNYILKENIQLKDDVDTILRHDLKTPLNVFMWAPDFIKSEGDLSEKQNQTLDILKQSSLSMMNMINNSINLLKMERGEYTVQAAMVDICKTLKQIKNEMTSQLKTKQLDMPIEIKNESQAKPDMFLMEGEEILFYNIFSNLIKNAIEASPIGKSIKIIMEKTDLVIRIRNLGEVPDDIKTVFFNKYISGKKNSVGLGTYSAMVMTKTLGGTIMFDTSVSNETSVILNFTNRKNKET